MEQLAEIIKRLATMLPTLHLSELERQSFTDIIGALQTTGQALESEIGSLKEKANASENRKPPGK